MRVPQSGLSRRDLLKGVLPAALAVSGMPRLGMADDKQKLPPVRVITRGPKHHWFAYYDKLEFDPTGRYCLGRLWGGRGGSVRWVRRARHRRVSDRPGRHSGRWGC